LGPAGETTFPRIPEEKLKTVVDETIADVKARHDVISSFKPAGDMHTIPYLHL